MALGRLNIRVGKKGKAVPHFNYIFAQDKYTNKKIELIDFAHGNMPSWAKDDPKNFWEMSDLYERKNGSVYREQIISLPRELNLEQQKNFLNDWIEQEVGPSHPFSYAIHSPKGSDKNPQPHVHLIICERTLDNIERTSEQFFKRYNPKDPSKGGAKKANTGLTHNERKQQILSQRKRYGDLLNHHLIKNGFQPSVDMRNWRERGLTEPPKNLSMAEFKTEQTIRELSEKYLTAPAVTQKISPSPEPKIIERDNGPSPF